MSKPEVLNDAVEAPNAAEAAGFGRIKPTVAAERALKERPVFSIRLQVYFSVFFLFAIVLGIGLLTSATTSPGRAGDPPVRSHQQVPVRNRPSPAL